MAKLIDVVARSEYMIQLSYDDGITGEVDLSHLAGKGVFAAWNDLTVFQNVTVGGHGEIHWTETIELCADAMYLQIANKTAEDLYPSLKAPADA